MLELTERIRAAMSRFVRPHIARMAGYVPGEQPRDGGFIKLNTNENPYPPSPRVKAALVEAVNDRLRLYPDPLATAFCQTAAQLHGVEPEMVMAGNGSDDLLTILTRAFVGPGDLAAFPSPSYLLYSTLVAASGRPVGRRALHARLDARLEHARPSRAEAFCSPTPIAPRGPRMSREQVAELLEAARLPAGRRRGLRRFRRPAVPRHAADRGPSQRDRHAIVQQGIRPGRHPPGIPGRPARDGRAADQGQGLVQLRHC